MMEVVFGTLHAVAAGVALVVLIWRIWAGVEDHEREFRTWRCDNPGSDL